MKISTKQLSLDRKRKSHITLPDLKLDSITKRNESCLARLREQSKLKSRLKLNKWEQLKTNSHKLDQSTDVPKLLHSNFVYGSTRDLSQSNSRNTTLYQPRSTNTLLKARLPNEQQQSIANVLQSKLESLLETQAH